MAAKWILCLLGAHPMLSSPCLRLTPFSSKIDYLGTGYLIKFHLLWSYLRCPQLIPKGELLPTVNLIPKSLGVREGKHIGMLKWRFSVRVTLSRRWDIWIATQKVSCCNCWTTSSQMGSLNMLPRDDPIIKWLIIKCCWGMEIFPLSMSTMEQVLMFGSWIWNCLKS